MSDTKKQFHPGEILEMEFLEPLNINAYQLAKALNVQQTRISQILYGKRSITVDTAIRLSKYFDKDPEYWLDIQNKYDIKKAIAENQQYSNIKPYKNL